MAQARAAALAAEAAEDTRDDEPRGTSPFAPAPDEERSGLDLLDVVEAMSAHFHEHHREILTRWSWKLFCAKWVRLIAAAEREEAEREERALNGELEQLKRAQAEQRAELARLQGIRG